MIAGGVLLGKFKTYINPGHFLALPDDNSGIGDIVTDTDAGDAPRYNLQGIRVTNPRPGEVYIQNGKK